LGKDLCQSQVKKKARKKRQVGSETPVSQCNAEVLKCLFRCFGSLFSLLPEMGRMIEARQLQKKRRFACSLKETKEEVKKICWVPSVPPGVLQRKGKSKREDE
jgi:hypothetical protein